MEKTLSKNIRNLLLTVSPLFFVLGCTTIKDLMGDSGEQLPAGGFRGTAAIRNQTVPLPVDIAENILAIENGQIVTGDAPIEEQGAAESAERKVASFETDEDEYVEEESTHPFSGRKRISRKRKYRRRRIAQGGKTIKYKVKNNDTLMKIAFAKYGDIFRWRDIYNDNRDVIKDYNRLRIGSLLTLNGVEFIVIEKNGEPYLIRRGDTLVGISRNLYGNPGYWMNLWKNNTQLITDPNKIYAGFTIYYRPKSEVVKQPRFPSSK